MFKNFYSSSHIKEEQDEDDTHNLLSTYGMPDSSQRLVGEAQSTLWPALFISQFSLFVCRFVFGEENQLSWKAGVCIFTCVWQAKIEAGMVRKTQCSML